VPQVVLSPPHSPRSPTTTNLLDMALNGEVTDTGYGRYSAGGATGDDDTAGEVGLFKGVHGGSLEEDEAGMEADAGQQQGQRTGGTARNSVADRAGT
jgi:hypothetical protein